MAGHAAWEVNGLTVGGVLGGAETETLLCSPYVHLKFTDKNIQEVKWFANISNLTNLFPSPELFGRGSPYGRKYHSIYF
jgi:hypothetical protein